MRISAFIFHEIEDEEVSAEQVDLLGLIDRSHVRSAIVDGISTVSLRNPLKMTPRSIFQANNPNGSNGEHRRHMLP